MLTCLLVVILSLAFVGCGGAAETYTLKSISIESTIAGGDTVIEMDKMTEAEKTQYNAVIAMYGNTVEISKDTLKFSGSVTKIYGIVKYTLDGDKMNTDSETLKATFNLTELKDGNFSFGISYGGVKMVFTYKK